MNSIDEKLNIFMSYYFSDYHPVSREVAKKRVLELIDQEKQALIKEILEALPKNIEVGEDTGMLFKERLKRLNYLYGYNKSLEEITTIIKKIGKQL